MSDSSLSASAARQHEVWCCSGNPRAPVEGCKWCDRPSRVSPSATETQPAPEKGGELLDAETEREMTAYGALCGAMGYRDPSALRRHLVKLRDRFDERLKREQEKAHQSVECCAQCGEPKNRTNQAGDEVANGWPFCENPSCVAFGQPVASAWYRRSPSSPAPSSETLQFSDVVREKSEQAIDEHFTAARAPSRGSEEELKKLLNAWERTALMEPEYSDYDGETIQEFEKGHRSWEERLAAERLAIESYVSRLRGEIERLRAQSKADVSVMGQISDSRDSIAAELASLEEQQLTGTEAQAIVDWMYNSIPTTAPTLNPDSQPIRKSALSKLRLLSTSDSEQNK